MRTLALLFLVLAVAGCASRPINPPLAQADRKAGYRYETRPQREQDSDTFVILAFSGGGTRAAAFSFGVLEELRKTEVFANGRKERLLDETDVITGVSGGSFTALAYGLYGERLFDEYPKRFLKRNVQGELLTRFLSPGNWVALSSEGWGRSEMAAQLYDEILFENATFADIAAKDGPLIMATATDISTGSRLGFVQTEWDLICSDLSKVPLSRAAAASSAVPLALSPVTINNYGGNCNYKAPNWVAQLQNPGTRSRPAGRALQRLKEMQSFEDSANRPYLHLVDGGISDNLGMRALLETLEELEASRGFRRLTKIEQVKRFVVIVVNSLSIPKTNWDKSERPPNDFAIVLKATGVPIDRYSYEAVELLKDIITRWKELRALKSAGAFANAGNTALARAADVPDIDLYAIDVSFHAHPDASEREFLNDLPTSFALSDDAVDRLRTAAGVILRDSPEFQRLLKSMSPPTAASPRATTGGK